jgi:hypothetical protein
MAAQGKTCDKCAAPLEAGEAQGFFGQELCEDCYLEAMSPTRTCDPWAVHTARSLKDSQGAHQLTSRQQQLYDLVKERGEVSLEDAARSLNLKEEEVRREFATLRHMELLRACKKDNLILLTRF